MVDAVSDITDEEAFVSPQGLTIQRLALHNFRNHASTVLEMDARPVCLFGANGAGKTNLLEAVSMLGPGKGLRAASLPSLVRVEAGESVVGGWAISARMDDAGLDRQISVGLDVSPDGRTRRVAKLDDAPVSQTNLAELVRVVWLTPAMDRVFAGPAGDRRKFYDRQVLAHVPAHGSASAAYEKAMRERNALFEQGRMDASWLDALEARLAEAGAAIAVNRATALKRIQAAIDARPEGHFPKADLSIAGKFEAMALQGDSQAAIEGAISDSLKVGRARDSVAGRTLAGVHRSDLQVVHRPKQLPAAQCSTGEQKALLMGMILANAKALLEGDFAPNPLLLLDEAAAHLDSVRRAALYDELAALGGQAWLTGTDAALFDAFGDRAQRFCVENGQVIKV
ncbi:DNA replication/repair protein RecF [Hirschia baltica]|uniref:DNA replication and repair protein RecF n=1 Tax=Hirschia baltica (strain ATCC 49814 / DSM 5838 / IFAM 1418) TaxID=582402 RepID=C6XRU4_HIRBI|nr:DNA replication/repair protein RecF [Hirschia baltica]ACT60704.1 DNA replication and repair protein RecF [Hirschia baltica ATCC 49814]